MAGGYSHVKTDAFMSAAKYVAATMKVPVSGSARSVLAPAGILPLAVRLAYDVPRIRDGLFDGQDRVSARPFPTRRQCKHGRPFDHVGRRTLRHLRLEGRIPGGFCRFPCGDGLQRCELSARMPVQEFEERCAEETPEPRRMTEVLRADARLREIPERLH